jgi:hypothetical protein
MARVRTIGLLPFVLLGCRPDSIDGTPSGQQSEIHAVYELAAPTVLANNGALGRVVLEVETITLRDGGKYTSVGRVRRESPRDTTREPFAGSGEYRYSSDSLTLRTSAGATIAFAVDATDGSIQAWGELNTVLTYRRVPRVPLIQ